MKLKTGKVFCIVLMAVGLMARPAAGQNKPAPRHSSPMTVTRLYTGADGQSHFDQVPVELSEASEGAESSAPVKTSDAYIVRCAPGFFENWHNADQKRYIVVVSGEAEVTSTTGEKTLIEPGRVYLAEDLTGKGHTFRVVGKKEWVALFVDFASKD